MTLAAPLRLALAGDAMLGRLVGAQIRRQGPAYPLGAIAPLMRRADLAIVNLECALTDCPRRWGGAPKRFYFGAPPDAARSLSGAGIGIASLANNHILDFEARGLRDTLAALEGQGIGHAGAGTSLAAALAPAIAERRGLRVGMAAFCDHQRDFAAGPRRPGIACIDPADGPGALRALAQALAPLRAAGVEWPILSLHWGPNVARRPAAPLRLLAHAAIDMGWKIVFGHSAHVFQGIELRRGFPILYAAGDLVDDYAVDQQLHNDHQLLFELEVDGERLRRILLHPLFIARCRTVPADARQAAWIAGQMQALCREFGTRIDTAILPWTITPPW